MNNNDFPSMAVIRGLIATSVGLMCIFFAYNILVRLVLFTCGVTLVFYGLQQLNITALNDVIVTIKSFIRRLFS